MALALHVTGNDAADDLLSRDPLAQLIGMLLDQQVPMEAAFLGPWKLADRMGGLDVRRIAEADDEEFLALCAQPPAVHRFSRSMGARVQELCRYLVAEYDGDPTRIWTDGEPDGAEVLRRLKALPGYGEQKAKIFLALLGKQLGVRPAGWREAAGDYGVDGSRRSVADVVDKATLLEVRATKKELKAAARSAKA